MSIRTKIRLASVSLLILVAGAAFLDFPQFFQSVAGSVSEKVGQKLPFRLGLDLQGGTHLVYEADVSQLPEGDVQAAVEGVRDVIERRVDAFGVSEPVVQTTRGSGAWRIIVELAGVHEVGQAIKMIGETPLLEFKELNPNPQVNLTAEQQAELDSYNADAEVRAKEILQKALDPSQNFEELAKTLSEDEGSKQAGGDIGYSQRASVNPERALVPEFEKACFDDLQVGETAKSLVPSQFGYHIIKKTGEVGTGESYEARCSHILVRTKTATDIAPAANTWLYTGLTGKQLKRAVVTFASQIQTPQVSLEFNSEGGALFEEITRKNLGRPVAIFLDGQPISTPTVQDVISQGQAVISGNFSISEARLLAQRLNAGALPVPIALISQQTIGATLGNISVQKSLEAGILSVILIAVFMVLMYRLSGILAVIALLSYGVLLLLVFKLVPVTLTLAGIAGFILSLGMAVDANVLISERLKEELRLGKPIEIAVKLAFQRAWPAIYDGNASTILTCLVLMGFTTSLIKGFAVTLTIGIIMSVFSAMVITRVLSELLIRTRLGKHLWLFGGNLKKVTPVKNV